VPALVVDTGDTPVLAVGCSTLRAVRGEHGQAVAVDIHSLPVAVAVNKDLKGAVGVEAEKRSDHKGSAALEVGPVKEQLAVEGILGVAVVESSRILVALKEHLAVGLVRQMTVCCPPESRSVQ
jgi:hypothetical protein